MRIVKLVLRVNKTNPPRVTYMCDTKMSQSLTFFDSEELGADTQDTADFGDFDFTMPSQSQTQLSHIEVSQDNLTTEGVI